MAQDLLNVEGIQGLFIYDAQGNWVANSFSEGIQSKNNSDRAYFLYHRDNADEAIHIGSIVESRSTGDMVIPISRRINAPDGTFAGVALATVPVAYFQAFFERMDVDDKGVIFLALNNGDLLARRPTLSALTTTNVAKGDIFTRYLPHGDSGTAVIKSVVDGVERIYAYRRVSGLPIVAAAGVSCQPVFAPWWAYAYRSMALIGMIILALASLGALLYRQIQQLITAEAGLNTARNELEVIAQTDSLTHLANRRCFDTAFEKEWGRASRNNSVIAIILLDIDWFKQYNVLPETDLAGALSVAEKVRLSIVNALIDHSASPVGNVTISSGVVAISAPIKDGRSYALAEADRLLYCAKSDGRNRVEGRLIQGLDGVGQAAIASHLIPVA